MPKIRVKLPDGKVVQVDADNLGPALQQLPEGSLFNVTSGDQTYALPFTAKNLQSAIGEDSRIQTSEEYYQQKALEKARSSTKAGLAGFARGATLGLSDLAAVGVGAALGERPRDVADKLALLEQASPTVSTITEIGGAVAPSLLSGGASAAATGAKSAGVIGRATSLLGKLPAGQLARASRAAEAAMLGKASGILGKLAAKTVPYAAEGAAFGLGTSVSDAVIHDTELFSEHTAANVGLGALFGGAIPLGLTALGAGARLLGKGAGRIRPKVGTASQALDDAEVLAKVANGEDVGIANTMHRAGSVGKGYTADQLALSTSIQAKHGSIGAYTDDVAVRTSDDLNKAMDDSSLVFDNSSIGKFEHVLEKIDPHRAGAALDESGRVFQDLDNALNLMKDEGVGEFAQTYVNPLLKRMEVVKKHLYEYADEFTKNSIAGKVDLEVSRRAAANVFREADTLKKDFGKLVKRLLKSERDAPTPRVNTREMYWEMFEDLRSLLMKEEFFGEMAKAQRNVNTAWNHWFNAAEHEMPRLRIKAGKKPSSEDPSVFGFEKAYEIDRGKVRSLIDNADRPGGDQRYNNYLRFLEKNIELVESHMDNYVLSKADLAAGQRAIDGYRDILNMFEKHKLSKQIYQSVFEAQPGLLGSVGTRIGGQVIGPSGMAGGAGFLLGGPVGAALGVGVSAIRDPHMMSTATRVLGGLTSGINKTSTRIDRAVRAFVGKASRFDRATSASMAEKVANAKRQYGVKKGESEQESYEKVRKQLEQISNGQLTLSSPELWTQVNKDLPAQLNAHAKRAAAHLLKNAPQVSHVPMSNLIGSGSAVSKRELSDFFSRLAVAHDPTVAIEAMASGRLTAAMADTLRQVYPRLYAELIYKLQTIQADKPLSPSAKSQLSLLLDRPMDPRMDPRRMAVIARVTAEQEQQQGDASKINPQAAMSGTQRLQSKFGGIR